VLIISRKRVGVWTMSQRLIPTRERLISEMLSGPNEGREICILKNIVFQSTF
jgi:hypothetical protein